MLLDCWVAGDGTHRASDSANSACCQRGVWRCTVDARCELGAAGGAAEAKQPEASSISRTVGGEAGVPSLCSPPLVYTPTLTLTLTSYYDVINGIQDLKIYSHNDSPRCFSASLPALCSLPLCLRFVPHPVDADDNLVAAKGRTLIKHKYL